MTDRFKEALEAMRRAFERTDLGLDSWLRMIGAVVADHRQTHLESLTIATEAEQLRKENEELKVRVEELEQENQSLIDEMAGEGI